jgi:hypothetical protein
MSLRACLVPGNQSKFFADDPWLKTRAMTGVPLDCKVSEKLVHDSAMPYCFGEPSERLP